MSKVLPILITENITKQFSGLTAVKDLSIQVGQGEITSIIGPNGAGKTTLFNLLTGFSKPTLGEARFKGQKITGLPPYRITRLGMARTFQLTRIFPKLSVLDNIMLGCLGLKGDNPFYAVLKTKEILDQFYQTKEKALKTLETVGLPEFAKEYANNLSYGQQKLVEIGRALTSDPQVLLLDEPMAGLSMTMIDRIIDLIFRLKKQGKTIVFIEHNLGVVMDISEQIIVLNFGQKIASGSPTEIRSNEEVIDAYLGI